VKTLLLLLLTFVSGSIQAAQIDGVPFVRQDSSFCGPASLASVMAFYKVDIDQKTIGESVYIEALKGTLITDLDNYAQSKGFITRLAQGSLADIRGFIDQGRPLIVLVDLGFWFISRPHYLVVTGYTDDEIIAHTGYEASKHFTHEEFESIWQRKGSAYLVIHP